MRNSQVSMKHNVISCRPVDMPTATKPQFVESASCLPILYDTVKTVYSNSRCGPFSGKAQSAGKAST